MSLLQHLTIPSNQIFWELKNILYLNLGQGTIVWHTWWACCDIHPPCGDRFRFGRCAAQMLNTPIFLCTALHIFSLSFFLALMLFTCTTCGEGVKLFSLPSKYQQNDQYHVCSAVNVNFNVVYLIEAQAQHSGLRNLWNLDLVGWAMRRLQEVIERG